MLCLLRRRVLRRVVLLRQHKVLRLLRRVVLLRRHKVLRLLRRRVLLLRSVGLSLPSFPLAAAAKLGGRWCFAAQPLPKNSSTIRPTAVSFITTPSSPSCP